MSCQENVCTYRYLSSSSLPNFWLPSSAKWNQQIPTLGGSRTWQWCPTPRRFHHPHPTSMAVLLSHGFQSFPQHCRQVGIPSPTTADPHSTWPRCHLPAPSWHQMFAINSVRTQLSSVSWKAQTPNISQMKQEQARCQWLRPGSQPLLHTVRATGGK